MKIVFLKEGHQIRNSKLRTSLAKYLLIKDSLLAGLHDILALEAESHAWIYLQPQLYQKQAQVLYLNLGFIRRIELFIFGSPIIFQMA